jgi:hypothetical protein
MLGEAHPLLSGVIATFHRLLSQRKQLKEDCPELALFIDEGLFWAERYYNMTRNTTAFSVAIGMSPYDTMHHNISHHLCSS